MSIKADNLSHCETGIWQMSGQIALGLSFPCSSPKPGTSEPGARAIMTAEGAPGA